MTTQQPVYLTSPLLLLSPTHTSSFNQVDRCYGWKTLPDGPIRDALAQQDENVIREFNDRTERITVQLNELGLNAKVRRGQTGCIRGGSPTARLIARSLDRASTGRLRRRRTLPCLTCPNPSPSCIPILHPHPLVRFDLDQLYWENDSLDDTVSLVPTSAVSGEGVPDLLMMLITLTQVPNPTYTAAPPQPLSHPIRRSSVCASHPSSIFFIPCMAHFFVPRRSGKRSG